MTVTNFKRDIFDNIVTLLDNEFIHCNYGATESDKADRSPAVFIYPTSFEVNAPSTKRVDIGPTANKAIWDQVQRFNITCWGDDIDQANDIMHNVLAAMYKIKDANIKPEGGSFDTESQFTHGKTLTFTFFFIMPVLQTPVPIVPVTGQSHSTDFAGELIPDCES